MSGDELDGYQKALPLPLKKNISAVVVTYIIRTKAICWGERKIQRKCGEKGHEKKKKNSIRTNA